MRIRKKKEKKKDQVSACQCSVGLRVSCCCCWFTITARKTLCAGGSARWCTRCCYYVPSLHHHHHPQPPIPHLNNIRASGWGGGWEADAAAFSPGSCCIREYVLISKCKKIHTNPGGETGAEEKNQSIKESIWRSGLEILQEEMDWNLDTQVDVVVQHAHTPFLLYFKWISTGVFFHRWKQCKTEKICLLIPSRFPQWFDTQPENKSTLRPLH